MSIFRTLFLAAGAATVTLALGILCIVGHAGADGPHGIGWIGLILLFPAYYVGPLLGDSVSPFVLGFLQWFAVYFLVLVVWRRLHARKTI